MPTISDLPKQDLKPLKQNKSAVGMARRAEDRSVSGPVDGVARGRRLQSGRPAVGAGSERPRLLKQTDRGVKLVQVQQVAHEAGSSSGGAQYVAAAWPVATKTSLGKSENGQNRDSTLLQTTRVGQSGSSRKMLCAMDERSRLPS